MRAYNNTVRGIVAISCTKQRRTEDLGSALEPHWGTDLFADTCAHRKLVEMEFKRMQGA